MHATEIYYDEIDWQQFPSGLVVNAVPSESVSHLVMKNGFKQGEEGQHRRRDGPGKKNALLLGGNWVEST